MPISKWYLTYL